MLRKGTISELYLGRVVATPCVLDAVPRSELLAALMRHRHCDWGAVSDWDWAANDHALTHGGRVLSAYVAGNKTRFWIITEANRAATTVLLPSDY